MMELDAVTILQGALARELGLPDYKAIMDQVWRTDVSADAEFQRRFDHYYRVRRNAEWRAKYYSIFQDFKKKSDSVSFEDIFLEVFKRTNRVEASFSSKMLATLNPSKPIWDSQVLKFFRYTVTEEGEARLRSIIDEYKYIDNWYQGYVDSAEGLRNIQLFDRLLPEHSDINPVKKIDCLIWSRDTSKDG